MSESYGAQPLIKGPLGKPFLSLLFFGLVNWATLWNKGFSQFCPNVCCLFITLKPLICVSSKGSLCQDGSVEILQSPNGPSVQELWTILNTMDHSQDYSWSWISGNFFENILEHMATSGNIWKYLAMATSKNIWEKLSSNWLQVVKIEEELSAIGENQKQLEISEEKARRREEKYQVKQRCSIRKWRKGKTQN